MSAVAYLKSHCDDLRTLWLWMLHIVFPVGCNTSPALHKVDHGLTERSAGCFPIVHQHSGQGKGDRTVWISLRSWYDLFFSFKGPCTSECSIRFLCAYWFLTFYRSMLEVFLMWYSLKRVHKLMWCWCPIYGCGLFC
jgi:hypothetical protein